MSETENVPTSAIEYQFKETSLGVWRTYDYGTGQVFREFRSYIDIFGFPLLHMTFGKNPETNRRIIARGIIAIGRLAFGGIAIGHASAGIFAIGQAAIGMLFLGQLGIGLAGIAQAAIALIFGLGQFATGYVAVGQLAVGWYAMGQGAFGKFVYCMERQDSEAYEFFKIVLQLFGK